MDKKKNNDSRARLHEDALARRMSETLDGASAKDAGNCPDADVIAAYHERALQPDEIAHCESHIAGCSRCREILAILAASADAALAEKEVARHGELVPGTEHPTVIEIPRKEKQLRPSRFDWRVQWLAPALGVAAVLVVWFVVRPPWPTMKQGALENLVAQGPKIEPQPGTETQVLDQVSRMEPKKSPETDTAIPKNRPFSETKPGSPAPPTANRLAENKALEKLNAQFDSSKVALEEQKKTGKESAAVTGFATPPAPSAAMPPPMAKAQLQAANSGSPASPNVADGIFNMPARDKQAAGAVARADASSNPRSSAEMAMSARSDQPKSVALDAANEGGVAIRSPSGKIMWRVGRGGKIQSSADAGRTWRLQKSPSQQDWIAGTATSDAACWLVGRKGAIARTTDGNTWIQIASPQAAAGGVNKLPDWTGVAATSAQAATIISSENQSYSTQDGGRTWVLE